jgi:hypothetical protein
MKSGWTKIGGWKGLRGGVEVSRVYVEAGGELAGVSSGHSSPTQISVAVSRNDSVGAKLRLTGSISSLAVRLTSELSNS